MPRAKRRWVRSSHAAHFLRPSASVSWPRSCPGYMTTCGRVCGDVLRRSQAFGVPDIGELIAEAAQWARCRWLGESWLQGPRLCRPGINDVGLGVGRMQPGPVGQQAEKLPGRERTVLHWGQRARCLPGLRSRLRGTAWGGGRHGRRGLAHSPFYLQTSGWCPSSSRSLHRSCLSTAGTAAPDSSTSACPLTPCCSAGYCRCPGAAAPPAATPRSPCRYCRPLPPAPRPGPAPNLPLSARRYFRYGAPPVINPLGTDFPANTSMQSPFFIKMLQSNASVNVSHPAPGDWFVAAHLPPSSQKIEVKVKGPL